MSDIINFTFSEKNSNVRIVLINAQPYFSLQDVCNILKINNITTLRERLDQKGVMLKERSSNEYVKLITHLIKTLTLYMMGLIKLN